MKFPTANKLVILIKLFLLFSHGILCQRSKTHKIEIDFETEMKNFCKGKPNTNVCSTRHIEIMLDIERQRLQRLELARQMKRMKSEVIRKLFNMNF